MGWYQRRVHGRDVMLNIEVPREDGAPFIAELQCALSGIAILKKSEQKVYSIMRMTRASDLRDTFVFSTGETARGSLSTASTISAVRDAETIDFGRAKIASSEKAAEDARIASKSTVASDVYLDLEQGKLEMIPKDVIPGDTGSKTAALSLDVAPSATPRVEKPLPDARTRKAEAAADADFQPGFFSCACKPCTKEVRAAEMPDAAFVFANEREDALVFSGNERH